MLFFCFLRLDHSDGEAAAVGGDGLDEGEAAVPEVNEKIREAGGVPVDTLVAGIEEGRRSFKIVRAKPDGKSYARDIANKYGLSLPDIEKRLAERKQN